MHTCPCPAPTALPAAAQTKPGCKNLLCKLLVGEQGGGEEGVEFEGLPSQQEGIEC